MSGRHDRARGVWHQPSRRGRGGRGRGSMKARRLDAGMDKAAFEALLRRLDVRGRR